MTHVYMDLDPDETRTSAEVSRRVDALERALLRCLREIQPHHIPGDVYEQAQTALATTEARK